MKEERTHIYPLGRMDSKDRQRVAAQLAEEDTDFLMTAKEFYAHAPVDAAPAMLDLIEFELGKRAQVTMDDLEKRK